MSLSAKCCLAAALLVLIVSGSPAEMYHKDTFVCHAFTVNQSLSVHTRIQP